MNYCSKPLTNYRENSKADEVLPRLFTPSKVPLVQHWLMSGPQYEEKLIFLRNILRRQEEREATRKVLKMSFHPEVVPHVEKWLRQAPEDEKRVITRMFRTIESDPIMERAELTAWDESARRAPPVSMDTGGKAINTDERVKNAMQMTSPLPPMSDHFVYDNTIKTHNKTFPKTSQMIVSDHISHKTTFPMLERPASTQHHSKKVHWRQEVSRPATAGGPYMVGMRNEFDIFPDWRAPHRAVVPMTQVPYRVRALQQTPQTTKHACTYGSRARRDFVIHPEWITH